MKSCSVPARRRVIGKLSKKDKNPCNETNHGPIKKPRKIAVRKKKDSQEVKNESHQLITSGESSSFPTEQPEEEEFEFPTIKEALIDAYIEKWLEREQGPEFLGLYPIEDSVAEENRSPEEEDFVDSILNDSNRHGK